MYYFEEYPGQGQSDPHHAVRGLNLDLYFPVLTMLQGQCICLHGIVGRKTVIVDMFKHIIIIIVPFVDCLNVDRLLLMWHVFVCARVYADADDIVL